MVIGLLSTIPVGAAQAQSSNPLVQRAAGQIFAQFELSRTKPLLQVGDTFPLLELKSAGEEVIRTRGQRLLLVIGGPCVVTCPKLFEQLGARLERLKIRVVNVVVAEYPADDLRLPDKVALVDMRDAASPTAGKLGRQIGLPSSPAYYLLEKDGKIVFESTSSGYFLNQGYFPDALGALEGAKGSFSPFRRPRPGTALPQPLPPGFASVLSYAQGRPATVVLLSNEDCTVCQGFFASLTPFAKGLLQKGYGVVFAHLGQRGANGQNGGIFRYYDPGAALSKVYGFGRYPAAFLLKGKNYAGEVPYLKVAFGAGPQTDEPFRLALARALEAVAR